MQKLVPRAAALAAALVVFAPAAHAQGGAVDTRCSTVPVVAQDACQKAIDVFNLVAPQLGTVAASAASTRS